RVWHAPQPAEPVKIDLPAAITEAVVAAGVEVVPALLPAAAALLPAAGAVVPAGVEAVVPAGGVALVPAGGVAPGIDLAATNLVRKVLYWAAVTTWTVERIKAWPRPQSSVQTMS